VAAFLVIVLILLLLYGGDRLAIVGKGLGEGVKAFRKSVRNPEPPPPTRTISVEVSPPKLLPAKGETSTEQVPSDDHERH
jgi:sec-independent protein translocase protein TatA